MFVVVANPRSGAARSPFAVLSEIPLPPFVLIELATMRFPDAFETRTPFSSLNQTLFPGPTWVFAAPATSIPLPPFPRFGGTAERSVPMKLPAITVPVEVAPSTRTPSPNSPLSTMTLPRSKSIEKSSPGPGTCAGLLGGSSTVSAEIAVPGVSTTRTPVTPPCGTPTVFPESRFPVPAPSSRTPSKR